MLSEVERDVHDPEMRLERLYSGLRATALRRHKVIIPRTKREKEILEAVQ